MAASLALGGCASLTSPDAAPPAAAVPTAWSSEARPAAPVQTPTDLAQWWQRFNDPQLSALVAQALQANTDVLSAQAALRQARAQREASAAGLYPNLGASAGGQRNTTGGNLASNSYSTSLDASWEPDVFAQFSIPMPKSWDEGTVTAQFIWTAGATGDVIWGIQGVALSNDDAVDTAFGTAVTVTDSVTAAGDVMVSGTTSAMTIAGTPAAMAHCTFLPVPGLVLKGKTFAPAVGNRL